MKIEETFVVAAPRALVWRFITDPNEMGPCIPGCQNIEIAGPTTYIAEVRIKIGPIKTTFNLEVEVTEEVAPVHVLSRTSGEEGSRASMVSAENVLRLADAEGGGTEVFYSSEVVIAGRLGKYGHGIMKKIARKLGDRFADAFRERVEAAAAEA
jgi:uncharacterized protein